MTALKLSYTEQELGIAPVESPYSPQIPQILPPGSVEEDFVPPSTVPPVKFESDTTPETVEKEKKKKKKLIIILAVVLILLAVVCVGIVIWRAAFNFGQKQPTRQATTKVTDTHFFSKFKIKRLLEPLLPF